MSLYIDDTVVSSRNDKIAIVKIKIYLDEYFQSVEMSFGNRNSKVPKRSYSPLL